MITIKQIFSVAILIGLSLQSYSQKDLLLYGFDNLSQAHYVNPAFRPNSKGFLAFPVLNQNIGFSHSGFQFNQFVQTRSQDDSLVLNPENAISKMNPLNYITSDIQNELFSFGFTLNESFFTFSIAHKLQWRFTYPKDLFKFVLEGNGGDFLGERASFDGLGMDAMSTVETAIGWNRKFGEKLTLGAKLKYIHGVGVIYTEKSNLGIYTDPVTFDITVDGEMEVRTANLRPLAEGTNLPIKEYFKGGNAGIGIDLGATYQLTDKLQVSASVIDLGAVKWKTRTMNMVSNKVDFTYEGVNMKLFLSDSSDVLKTFTDSLEKVFAYSENDEVFVAPLYTKWYLGGKLAMTEKISLGGTVFGEVIHSKYRFAGAVSANFQLSKWFRLAMNYSYYARSAKNIGVGFAINGGPIQFYVMSDNIIGIMAAHTAKNWHVRFGINILFGRDKKKKVEKASL